MPLIRCKQMEKEIGCVIALNPYQKKNMNVFSDIQSMLQHAITDRVANCVNGAMYKIHSCHAYQERLRC
jgi:hypothetical protein